MFDTQKPLLRLLHQCSDLIAVILGFLLNTILLVIVRSNKEKGLQSFSQVVFMNCILDLSLAFTTLIGEIEVETYGGVIFFIANSFIANVIPDRYHYILIYLWCTGLGFSAFYVPIPFWHRYMLICRGTVLSHKAIFTALFVSMFFCLWITTWQLFAFVDGDTRRNEFIPLINNSLWAPGGAVPMFSAFSIDSMPSIIYLSNCSICFLLAWAIPFYLFGKIYQNFLEHRGSMSNRAATLHKALNRALVSQALFPFILGSLPVTLVMATLTLKVHIPYLGLIGCSTLSWVPAVNSLLTMLLVPAYYRALLPKKILSKLTSVVESNSVQVKITNVQQRK